MIANKQLEEQIRAENEKVLTLLCNYLNAFPDCVKKEDVEELVRCGVSHEYAFAVLLAAELGLDMDAHPEDRKLFNYYFRYMFHKLDENKYRSNPYYRNIRIPAARVGTCELKHETFLPYEGFVCHDMTMTREGRVRPHIGFFATEFSFPALLEDGRVWMTITPNEIETMQGAVDRAFGHVLTFGLGLGYFAYMASEKENVDKVTVVEINEDVIALFQKYILPQFPNAGKIDIVRGDAFAFAERELARGRFDFLFADLWRDVSDGLPMYLQLKKYESLSPDTVFMYWIEKTLKCYL